jgi:catechol 2,3-dioxygenase-like lactoylglutathione lyase family enzyme
VLGRFLELSVTTPAVVEALEYYESLGFAQASVGEAWPHPYAVVTDGRMTLGLHAVDDPVTHRLTFVTPELRAKVVDELVGLGIEVDSARLDEAALNQVEFRDPAGACVRLLEARTYSPPALEPGFESALGYFEGYVLGTDDLATAGTFWERFGFVAFQDAGDEQMPPRLVASHRDVNLLFFEFEPAGPMLCFSVPDLQARVARLRDQGFAFARRVPRALQPGGAAVLEAPDGVQMLLIPREN